MTRTDTYIPKRKLSITVFCAILFLSVQNISTGQEKQRPNILFIAVDDLKPNMGCFGDPLAITPNIDAIAAKGMVFTKTYCQQAVCAPSRASLLTSQYPDQTKVWDLETLIRDKNPNIVTLPQYFRQNGYNSLGVGKIFDNRSVENNDELSWNKYGNPYQNQLYNPLTGKPSYSYAKPSAKDTIAILEAEAVKLGIDKQTYVKERYWPSVENANVPYDAYVDGAISKEGINLMNQLNSSGTPFFLAVGFQRPHLPFNAPKEFWDLYKREDFKLAEFRGQSKNSPSIAYHNSEELRSYTDIPKTGDLSNEKQLELIHAYYASISYIDFLVGKLTQRIKELGLEENTIIVLWGDHGWHLGDHNLWCKHSNFEEATRSPLIISYPGQPNPGKKYTHPTEFVDIATTLCELSDLKVPVDFEGESLVPVIENPDLLIREGALSQYPRNQYMGYTLRTDQYRYTKWVKTSDGSHYSAELYDYESDPLETVSQISNPDYLEVSQKLDSIVQSRIKIPSTQEKIEFKIQGLTIENDTVAVGNSEIRFEESLKYTSSNGGLLITHVPGNYSYSVKSKGYQQVNSKVTIANDTLISVFLRSEVYHVSLKIKGAWNNEVIKNVEVVLGNQNKKTNNDGDVSFDNISYNNYAIKVELENGFTQSFKNVEIFSDTSMVLYVDEPTFNVQFQVANKYSNLRIYESSVSLTDVSNQTNSDGLTYFKVPAGKYKVVIEHQKYSLLTDSIQIYSDTLFNYKLLPALSTIKFKLIENTTPVNKVSVIINGEQQISNNLGNALFKDYATFTEYNYRIEKEAYKIWEGKLFLINDTTINIQMEAIPSAVFVVYDNKDLKIWPNPVRTVIHFQIPENFSKGTSQILDMKGNIIISFPLNNKTTHEFSVKKLPAGTYLLHIATADKQIKKLFVKKE
jgi:iduronate 2-sulfatase